MIEDHKTSVITEQKVKSIVQKTRRSKIDHPRLVYNPDLPIMAKKDEIIAAIRKHPVIIVSGETGSGKTTQIPKFCLEAGRGVSGRIGCTQPRRIATTSVAHRIAEELGEEIGRFVGYKIRFQDRVHPESFIKIMTDGILLAETLSDPWLRRYDTLIVDEAHERSLNIDLILGILKDLLARRADLKVIITSATIDTEKFSKTFDDAPVIEVSGRMYPVAVRYEPFDPDGETTGDQTYIEKAVQAIRELLIEGSRGDILVFMPTEQDIRETCDLIRAESFRHVVVLPLYSRLSAKEQGQVFKPSVGRKIIVATNIAETSLTIPGIKYVVDTGLARIPRYTPRSRTTALPIQPISRSSADQRSGRCGRVQDGVCVRLYSEEDYQSRPLFTEPEIQRANLAEVILRMLALRLDDISAFPFIDHPTSRSINDGFELLNELGAIQRRSNKTGRYFLTDIGKMMARLPLDPRLSRMLIRARQEGCIQEIAVIAAALSIQDPRERPVDEAEKADRAQAVFLDPASDFISLLNIWKKYQEVLATDKPAAGLKRFCKGYFLSYRRMREWRDIYTQIMSMLTEFDLLRSTLKEHSSKKTPSVRKRGKKEIPPDTPFSPAYTAVHRAVLSGFLSNIAQKKEKNIFKGTKGREVMIFPGSAQFNKAGAWITAAEMVQTSRLFARTVAAIDPSWLEELGADQCKYTYLHPRWEKNRGEVVVNEQVSLYGLIIIEGRTVGYGRINLEEATEIFIRKALVDGEVRRPFAFMQRNQRLVNEILEMEDKLRRRDVFAGEEAIATFYREKLQNVYDVRTLARIIKQKGGDDFLTMCKEDLLIYVPDEETLSLFPDSISFGQNKFQSSYRFHPGDPADGVTVKIPATAASLVPPESADWLIPGLLAEKITALIKGLPKEYRKGLVPISETVAVIMAEMPMAKEALVTALSRFIFDRFGVAIPATAWDSKDLPTHLKMRVTLTSPNGKELLSGRDPSILQSNLNRACDSGFFEAVCKSYQKKGIKRWDFGNLPETLEFSDPNHTVWTFFPGLEKSESGDNDLHLRLYRRREHALEAHCRGVAALYAICLFKDLKFLKTILKIPVALKAAADYFGGLKTLEERLYQSVLHDFFCRNIRRKEDFESHAQETLPQLPAKARKKLEAVLPVLEAFSDARKTIFSLEKTHHRNSMALSFLDGLRQTLSKLLPQNFLELYPNDRLIEIVRYIKALSIRAGRGLLDPVKDQKRATELSSYQQKLDELLALLSPATSQDKRQAIEDFFWLLEEYKVSLFAQELKTATPISQKRLEAKISEIERMV